MAKRHPLRYMMIWVKRWLGTSKPTEWISAMATIGSVIAAITGAIYLHHNGFLDVKRSELEVKRAEMSIQNVKLELEQRDLVARREALHNQITSTEDALKVTKTELGASQSKLKDSIAKLANAEKNLGAYVAHEAAVNLLVGRHKLNTGIIPRLECSVDDNAAMNILNVTIEGKTNNNETITPSDKKELLTALKSLRKLTALTIINVHMDASDVSLLNALSGPHSLHLEHCDLSDITLKPLIIDENTSGLGFQNNPITRLPTVLHPWSILALYISDTKIGDEPLTPFLKAAVNLRAIGLARTLVTDATLKNIQSPGGEFDNIQLNGTGVSLDGIKSLIRKTRVRHVFMRMQKDRKNELEMFLKETGINCSIFMSEHGMGRGNTNGSTAQEPSLIIEPPVASK
jgi:hypothetical protein